MLPYLIVFGSFATALALLTLLARAVRRRGASGAVGRPAPWGVRRRGASGAVGRPAPVRARHTRKPSGPTAVPRTRRSGRRRSAGGAQAERRRSAGGAQAERRRSAGGAQESGGVPGRPLPQSPEGAVTARIRPVPTCRTASPDCCARQSAPSPGRVRPGRRHGPCGSRGRHTGQGGPAVHRRAALPLAGPDGGRCAVEHACTAGLRVGGPAKDLVPSSGHLHEG